MPVDGDLEVFLHNLSEYRSKPILLVERPSGRTDAGLPSGLCVNTDEADYIIVDKSAGPSRRAVIVAHEVAHVLLGHTGDAASTDLLAQVAPQLSSGLISRILRRHDHDDPDEKAAEHIATVIAVEHGRRQRAAELNTSPYSMRLR